MDETEVTLKAFREARQQRLECLLNGDGQIAPELINREREAICQHGRAVRAHAERLARSGR